MAWSCKKLGTRQVISIGLLCTILIFVILSIVGPTTSPWLLRALLFSVGFFLGHAVVAVQISTFINITSASMGRATTLFNVQNRIGSAVGVVLLASLLGAIGTINTTGTEQLPLLAYQFALLGSAAFLLVALFFALCIRKADFSATVAKQSPIKSSYREPIVKVNE